MKSLRVARAFGWNSAGSAAGMLASLGYTCVTARLVTPTDFGGYAAALGLTGVLGFIAGTGLTGCLLRCHVLTRQLLRATRRLSCAGGLAAFALAQLTAPASAALLGLSAVEPMVRILCCQFLVSPLAQTSLAALRRADRVLQAVLVELAGLLAGFGLSVVLLAHGFVPYALAVALPAGSALSALVAGAVLARTPLQTGRPASVRELLGPSAFFTGFGLLQAVTFNAPLWAAGAVLGSAAAGFYSRASLMVSIPLAALVQAVNQAVFAGLNEVRTGNRLPPAAVRDVLCVTSAIGCAAFGTCAGAGPAVLALLLGPGWETATALVPWLALGGALAVVYAATNAVDGVRHDTRTPTRAQLAYSAAVATAIAAGAATDSLRAFTLAAIAGPAAGLAMQVAQWRRQEVLVPGAGLRDHGPHLLLGCGLFVTTAVGARCADSGGGHPLAALAGAVVALVPASAACMALRYRLPGYHVVLGHRGRRTRGAPPAAIRA